MAGPYTLSGSRGRMEMPGPEAGASGTGVLCEAVDLGAPVSPGKPAFNLQVQLLISAQDVENYKVIKSELDRLRTMVEKSELWVDKKGSSKGEEVEAGATKDKKEVSEVVGSWGDRASSEGGAWLTPIPCVRSGPQTRRAFCTHLGRRAVRTTRSSRA